MLSVNFDRKKFCTVDYLVPPDFFIMAQNTKLVVNALEKAGYVAYTANDMFTMEFGLNFVTIQTELVATYRNSVTLSHDAIIREAYVKHIGMGIEAYLDLTSEGYDENDCPIYVELTYTTRKVVQAIKQLSELNVLLDNNGVITLTFDDETVNAMSYGMYDIDVTMKLL